MAIFARRVLQRMINENAQVLSAKQISEHVRRLNKPQKIAFDTEWEVVLLNALTKLGNIQYEPDLGGKRQADVLFKGHTTPELEFLADITTVSDEGNEERNPIERFWSELDGLLRKHPIDLRFFTWGVGGQLEGNRGSERMKLSLPPIAKLRAEVFNQNFVGFLKQIAADPGTARFFIIKRNGLDIEFCYDPKGRRRAKGWLSYTVAYSLEANPVHSALKRKSEQFKKTGYKGNFGVFLCDAGCDLLQRSTHGSGDYSVNQVVKEFLKKHSSISFVVTIACDMEWDALRSRKPELKYAFFRNPRLDASTVGSIHSILKTLPSHLPEPVDDAHNAAARVKRGDARLGVSFYGGIGIEATMNEYKITLSARALQQLLAGKIQMEKFSEDHGFVPSVRRTRAHNPFATMLSEGKSIASVSIEKEMGKDDDWIVLTFSDDPAIKPFSAPAKK